MNQLQRPVLKIMVFNSESEMAIALAAKLDLS